MQRRRRTRNPKDMPGSKETRWPDVDELSAQIERDLIAGIHWSLLTNDELLLIIKQRAFHIAELCDSSASTETVNMIVKDADRIKFLAKEIK